MAEQKITMSGLLEAMRQEGCTNNLNVRVAYAGERRDFDRHVLRRESDRVEMMSGALESAPLIGVQNASAVSSPFG